jgi:hypothetical protein
MGLKVDDALSGKVVSCVIKRIVNHPSHTEEKIVSVKVGDTAEDQAKTLVRLLNESCICGIERYEYELHSDELADVGMNHSNEAFLAPALARATAEEMMKALNMYAIRQTSVHPIQQVAIKLASNVTYCPTMTREKVEEIILAEVKKGIDLNVSMKAKLLYGRYKKAIDLMALRFGITIKNNE